MSSVLSERLLDEVVYAAVKGRLLTKISSPLPLQIQNLALSFFISNARVIPEISNSYLLKIAEMVRAHPKDWESIIRSEFREHPRDMILPPIPKIVPETPPNYLNRIIHGLFEEECRILDDQCVDLVLTSPPYANQRKAQYGGIDEDQYPEWSVGWMSKVTRLLKPNGSVAIIIQSHVDNSEESDYVLRTLAALKNEGWIRHRIWIWGKTDSAPLGRRDWPREAYEMIIWMSLGRQPYCNPKAGGNFSQRLGLLTNKGVGDHVVGASSNVEEGISRVANLLLVGTSRSDRATFNTHQAQYPVTLGEKIIKVLCPSRGTVLDPFMGSGTTALAALKNGRKYIGFEKEINYVNIARRRINKLRFTE